MNTHGEISPIKLRDEYLLRLGRISALFSSLEWHMAEGIQMLATSFDIDPGYDRLDERVKLMVAGEDFTILLQKLGRLFKYCVSNEKMLKDFEIISDRIDTLNRKMNKLVHTHSWYTVKQNEMRRSKLERKVDSDGALLHDKKVTLGELDNLFSDTKKAITILLNLIDNNIDSIKAQFEAKLYARQRDYGYDPDGLLGKPYAHP